MTKKILLLMLLAALGVITAGCGGSGTKAAGPITVTGTTTISNVKTGTLVKCKAGPGSVVPPPGHEVTQTPEGSAVSTGGLQLNHRQDGSLVAKCLG